MRLKKLSESLTPQVVASSIITNNEVSQAKNELAAMRQKYAMLEKEFINAKTISNASNQGIIADLERMLSGISADYVSQVDQMKKQLNYLRKEASQHSLRNHEVITVEKHQLESRLIDYERKIDMLTDELEKNIDRSVRVPNP